MPEIENHLGTLRQKRGISAAQLARTVGVTRQTIYAMEAGSYVPNTAVALRLAQALEVKVEDLFTLPAGRTHRSALGRSRRCCRARKPCIQASRCNCAA